MEKKGRSERGGRRQGGGGRSEGEREKKYKVIDRVRETPRKIIVITMDKVHLHTKFQQNTLACAC